MTVFCGYCGAPMGQPHWDCCPLHDKEPVVQSLTGGEHMSVLTRHRVINNTRQMRWAHDNDDGPIPWEDVQ